MNKITSKPLVNNRFIVIIDGMPSLSFSEVGIIQDTTEIQEVREFSDPFRVKRVPGAISHGAVTLKRAVSSESKALYEWRQLVLDLKKGNNNPNYLEAFGKFIYRKVIIQVLDSSGDVGKQITLFKAWPTKYEVSAFSALSPEILTETIELEYVSKQTK